MKTRLTCRFHPDMDLWPVWTVWYDDGDGQWRIWGSYLYQCLAIKIWDRLIQQVEE
jgi:hypothetical protein